MFSTCLCILCEYSILQFDEFRFYRTRKKPLNTEASCFFVTGRYQRHNHSPCSNFFLSLLYHSIYSAVWHLLLAADTKIYAVELIQTSTILHILWTLWHVCSVGWIIQHILRNLCMLAKIRMFGKLVDFFSVAQFGIITYGKYSSQLIYSGLTHCVGIH